MLLFGHRFIPSDSLYHVSDIDAIVKTPPSSCLLIDFSEANLDIISHAQTNNITFAIRVEDITQLIYAASLGASFVLVQKSLAKTAQDIAENYLFDAKIVVMIEEESEIEELALLGIDGVIFGSAIVKV